MFAFNGTKAIVTVSGTLGVGLPNPSSNQTLKRYYNAGLSLTGSAQNLITPTATKTLYITEVIVTLPAHPLVFGSDGSGILRMSGADGTVFVRSFTTPIACSTAFTIEGTAADVAANLTVIGFEQ